MDVKEQLYKAICDDNTDSIKLLLNNNPNIINEHIHKIVPVRPLELAIFKENHSLANLLISYGGDVNSIYNTEFGIEERIIHIACRTMNYDCIKLLIDNGANIEAKNNYGLTPLNSMGLKPKNENVKKIIDYLLSKGANPFGDYQDEFYIIPRYKELKNKHCTFQ